MDISFAKMKDAPWTGMKDSLEASEWWSDEGSLGGREGGLEGR